MSDNLINVLVVIIMLVIPLALLLLQLLLASRKRLFPGFIIPVIWSVLGIIWIFKSEFRDDREYILKLFILFLTGDVILLAILAYFKLYRKNKKNHGKHVIK